MSESEFHASYSGIGRLLRSELIGQALMERAERVRARAEETAPISSSSEDPGRYANSFRTELGISKNRARVEAKVVNDAPEALWVEKGNSHQDAQNILVRALQFARGGL